MSGNAYIAGWLGDVCVERLGYVPFEVSGDRLKISQIVGGTRGTRYVYVRRGEKLINIGRIEEAVLEDVEGRGRRRELEVYAIPRDAVKGSEIVIFHFTVSGTLFMSICTVDGDISCYSCPTKGEASERLVKRLVEMIEVVGGERSFFEFYVEHAPRMVREIRDIVSELGAEIFIARHASRLGEALENPYLALLTALAMPRWQGRLLALQDKLSAISEIWVVARMIRAIGGKISSPSPYWWIEYMNNAPFAYIRSEDGNEYTIFYQPTIEPHIIRMFIKTYERAHTTPDVVVFRGRVKGTGYGNLGELLKEHRPLILVEVKLGLETTEWRRPEHMLRQLIAYKEVLKPEHPILAVLTPAPYRRMFEGIGFKVFDNLLFGGIRDFEDYMRDIRKREVMP